MIPQSACYCLCSGRVITGWRPPVILSSSRSGRALLQTYRLRWHSAKRERFFNNRSHKKYCLTCGKPGSIVLEKCFYCGEELTDEHIQPAKRDPLLDAVLGSVHDGFVEMRRSFENVVLTHKFQLGRHHLLVVPKSHCYDMRQLRRKDLPMVRKLREQGMDSLKGVLSSSEQLICEQLAVCGFSYPSEFNQLHLHVVLPPFRNIALFRRPTFYPFEKVEKDIEKKGIVQPFVASEDTSAEYDFLATVAERDLRARANDK